MGPALYIIASLELEEVGVVYDPRLNHQRVPVEGGVTRRAPHLGAPTHLGNEHPAAGAPFGVGFYEFHRIDIVLATDVLVLGPFFDLIAVLADQMITNLAFPPGRKEPAAVVDGTLLDKLPAFRGVNRLVLETAQFGSFVVYELDDTQFFIFEVLHPVLDHPTFDDPVDVRLRIGQHTLFAVHEDILAVFLVLVGYERLGEPGIEEHPVPAVLAVGAVWVMDCTEKVRFGA